MILKTFNYLRTQAQSDQETPAVVLAQGPAGPLPHQELGLPLWIVPHEELG